VVYNNRGWAAPEMATRMQHPHGFAAKRGEFAASFGEGLDLSLLAQAVGCYGERVVTPDQLPGALKRARNAVRGGSIAVLDVLITPVTGSCPL
jgi:acetolactate synthase I/II/III large subunit